MRPRQLAVLAVAAALALLAWDISAHPWGWLYGLGVHPYPESSSTPWTYQLWSGLIPALTIVTLLGSVASLYHLHACHQDRCWRIGKHKVNGTPWCNLHHEQARPLQTTDDLLRDMAAKLDIIAGELKRWRSPSGLGRPRA